jgi:hypothetical protein
MARGHIPVSLLSQAPGGSVYLFERINRLLRAPGLKRFRAAVAYARWDGLGLIAPHIEELLKSGGEFQTMYGVGNGVTTPDSLLYNLYLQDLYSMHTYAGAVEDEYSNATFHPKFFEFKFLDRTVAILGSANLTGGGLTRNTELGFEVESGRATQIESDLDQVWNSMRAGAREVSLELIRKLSLGSEHDHTEGLSGKSGKPALKTGVKVSPKPLFAKVLELPAPAKKARILAKLDPLTDKPDRLYLQILAGETGGHHGGSDPGYQIQLPVATLAAFFAVGANQNKRASFRFGAETITVHLTHFANKTHRVRLRPLRDVHRPAIVVFERVKTDQYRCSIVPRKDYRRTLREKCPEQTRAGARRWGLE